MSLKKLYVAKCMEELESRAELHQKIKHKSTNLLISSADKVFRAAEDTYLDKDEEKAFVQYMRFIELVLLLRCRSDFKKGPVYNKLLQNTNIAIEKAESLKESLKKRYSIFRETTAKKNDFLTVIKNRQKYGSTSEISSGYIKDKENLFISGSELYSLITSEKSSIVIMDIRLAKDFEESHIKYHDCISLPQEILKPGLDAVTLESDLPRETLPHWFKYTDADQVILVDWDSDNEINLNVCLNILKSVICQISSLKRSPLILKGGYKAWTRKYPMLTTQVLNVDQLNDSRTNSVTSDSSNKEKLSISNSELYSLISEHSAIIIMDTRSTSDFAESHIKCSGCISIPEEILKPGITVAKLECSLPPKSLTQWYTRKDADFIILVDWESKDEITQNVHLNSLKLAMSKWDPCCILKKAPMVLRGGYKDFMRRYPVCTTPALNFEVITNLRKNLVVTDLSGCKIKALRAKTNTDIKTPVRGEEPVLEGTGRKEFVDAVKSKILSAIHHFSQIKAESKNNLNETLIRGPYPNSPVQTTIQVRVPYRFVEPKGATIKRIQQQTNTHIVTPNRDKEPIFEVTGFPENVEGVRKEIEALIASLGSSLTSSTTPASLTFPAPATKCTSSSSSNPVKALAPGKKPLKKECVVCYESPIVAALVPCGHNLFCLECANRICEGEEAAKCPVCRQTPTQAIRIYN